MSQLIPPGRVVDGWSWKFNGPVQRYTADAPRNPRVLLVKYQFFHNGALVGSDCLKIIHGDSLSAREGKAAAALVASWVIGLACSVGDGTTPDGDSNSIGWWLWKRELLTGASLDAMKTRCIHQAAYGGAAPFDVDAALLGSSQERLASHWPPANREAQ